MSINTPNIVNIFDHHISFLGALPAFLVPTNDPRLLRTLHGIVWRNFLRPHHGLAQQLYHKRRHVGYNPSYPLVN
jgi:hypothetical protein